jgi:sporulation protein YlmC with PRC-barrel domain
MTLAELLGREVVDDRGTVLGRVLDVRVVRGPGDLQSRLFVHGLIVSPRPRGRLWGYETDGERGPWLLRALIRRLHRDTRYLRWSSVHLADGRLHADLSEADIPLLHELRDA